MVTTESQRAGAQVGEGESWQGATQPECQSPWMGEGEAPIHGFFPRL